MFIFHKIIYITWLCLFYFHLSKSSIQSALDYVKYHSVIEREVTVTSSWFWDISDLNSNPTKIDISLDFKRQIIASFQCFTLEQMGTSKQEWGSACKQNQRRGLRARARPAKEERRTCPCTCQGGDDFPFDGKDAQGYREKTVPPASSWGTAVRVAFTGEVPRWHLYSLKSGGFYFKCDDFPLWPYIKRGSY